MTHTAFLARGDEDYGIGTVIKILSQGLMAKGLKPAVIALGGGCLTEWCRESGVECLTLKDTRQFQFSKNRLETIIEQARSGARKRRAAKGIADALQSLEAKRIAVQWPPHVAIAGMAARQAGAAPYWLMPNRVSNRWPFGINRRLYGSLLARHGITPLANSKYTLRSLGGNSGGRVLYLGVDQQRFSPERITPATREESGIPAGATVFGVFARFHPDKGQLLLLRALRQLGKAGRGATLLLLGGPTDGEYADKLRSEAAKPGGPQLIMPGRVTAPERYYPLLDVAVNMRVDPEPFGLSVIEAMSMGKPVLVHALGGPAETVLDDATGWHVTEPTEQALAAALKRVFDDRPRWPQMGQAARERVQQHFTLDVFVENYLSIVGG